VSTKDVVGYRSIALGWYFVLARRRPDVIGRIGKTETDLLEGVG
jgi:hypothetical protein